MKQRHELRIIGGLWKRSKLVVLDREGLRPTPDRVRETLYNWLGQTLDGWRVLDAFAGTGALGFEAASRGAATVVCLEQDAALVKAIETSRLRLGAGSLRVERADATAWMRAAGRESFELVLIDPPYDQVALRQSAVAQAVTLLVPGGWLYVEADARLPAPTGMDEHRFVRAGAVHAHLWQRPPLH